MADRRRGRLPQTDPFPGLATALRREARGERPEFSSALHERVMEAIVAPPRPARAGRPWRRAGGPVPALVGVGLVVMVTGAVMTAVSVRGRIEPAVVAPAAGIEQLPLPEELGARVVEELAQLGAAAVGIPKLSEIVPFDPALLAAVDETAIRRSGP